MKDITTIRELRKAVRDAKGSIYINAVVGAYDFYVKVSKSDALYAFKGFNLNDTPEVIESTMFGFIKDGNVYLC